MSLNTADKIFLVVGLVDFAGIFIVLGLLVVMAGLAAVVKLGVV